MGYQTFHYHPLRFWFEFFKILFNIIYFFFSSFWVGLVSSNLVFFIRFPFLKFQSNLLKTMKLERNLF